MPCLKKLFVVGSIAFLPFQAFAQSSGSTSTQSIRSPGAAQDVDGLATPTGHQVDFGVGGYTYVEPGDTSISIHGPKFVVGYTGAMTLNPGQRWFLEGDARGLFGRATYDGWCSPFLITPDGRSPNDYALDFGDPSPCSESGDKPDDQAVVGGA